MMTWEIFLTENKEHLVKQYIDDVISGKISSCRFVKLAVQRHLKDLETAGSRGLYFNEVHAQHAIDFFGRFLVHSKGEFAGKKFELEPWQQFIVWVIFGWKNEDGTRRFNKVYIEVPRKNGKSTFAAGVKLYLFVGDGEGGAEVYSAATKKDQARITFDEARRMVMRSPYLSKRLNVGKNNIYYPKTFSKFEPLSADTKTLDGLNIHAAVVDEFHAHPTSEVWDVIETATGARRQPMITAITTAGTDKHSVCFSYREYVRKLLIEQIQDDSFFGIIYTLDMKYDWPDIEDDDWEDEKNWYKANPNLGKSVKIKDIKDLSIKAKGMPRSLNSFLRYKLNIWTQASVRWIP